MPMFLHAHVEGEQVTPLFAQPSTGLPHTLTADVSRLLAIWRKQYGLARRSEDPFTAMLCASLSTAATWKVVR
jgi:hypothetical protein